MGGGVGWATTMQFGDAPNNKSVVFWTNSTITSALQHVALNSRI